MNETLSDRELIALAQQGKQNAFAVLMKRYGKGLLLHITKHLQGLSNKDTEMAEEPKDICQETFHKAFANIKNYNPEYKFSTWLYNIGKNAVIDYSRKRKIIMEAEIAVENTMGITNYGGNLKNSPEDNMISNQEYAILLRHIENLDDKYREIAKMRFIKEYAYEEIAKKLNLPLNTVRTRVKRGKDMLARKRND